MPPAAGAAHWNPVSQVAAPPAVAAAQHLWPMAPHASQVDAPPPTAGATQVKPVSQVPPAPPQQGPPIAPQATHMAAPPAAAAVQVPPV